MSLRNVGQGTALGVPVVNDVTNNAIIDTLALNSYVIELGSQAITLGAVFQGAMWIGIIVVLLINLGTLYIKTLSLCSKIRGLWGKKKSKPHTPLKKRIK